jgi:hypothetical protein
MHRVSLCEALMISATMVRHPVLNCRCVEGRIVEDDGTVRFLPGVHDCLYILERNHLLEQAAEQEKQVRKARSHAA